MSIHSFPKFIQHLSQDFTPVVATTFFKEQYVTIDLSTNNGALKAIDVSSSEDFERYINEYLAANNGKVAYGGYGEVRDIYRRSTHFNKQESEDERNIHLGLDLWCQAGTDILAPLDGSIHSFKCNDNFGDYGPTIIVMHKESGITFYTLYGHLSVDSIQNISVGDVITKGSVIASLGDASVNGDYAPHLHFQIIKDLQGNVGDYPGVSSKKDITFYLDNCPDPNLLLNI